MFDVEECGLSDNENLKGTFQRPIPKFSEGGSESNNSEIVSLRIIQLIQSSFKQRLQESINGNLEKPPKAKLLSQDV